MAKTIIPAEFQSHLPAKDIIQERAAVADALPMDVVFVGAGPAGLAGAIQLARLVKDDPDLKDLEIAVLDKGAEAGSHSLSGAVVNPTAFRELFPDLKDEDFPFKQKVESDSVQFLTKSMAIPIPTPPPMRNHGHYVASIAEIVRWMAGKAEELGVLVLPSYPCDGLLVEGKAVKGVVTTPTGLDQSGGEKQNFQAANDITAKITVLAEGTRGLLSQAYLDWQVIPSPNPQIYALGVKEVWETKVPLKKVIHTMGYPLASHTFGGSFMYPLEDNLVSIGLVAGLDSPDANLDVHEDLQRMKSHPLFKKYLEGGTMVEWGAKTIPEGGLYSLPDRLSGDGVLLCGDAAGFVDVPSLKGIHYAVKSGVEAARAIHSALKAKDFSGDQLSSYDKAIRESYIHEDLHRNRNVRLAFKKGFVTGAIYSLLSILTGGRFPSGRIRVEEDAREKKIAIAREPFHPDGKLTFSKVDAVFKSGNQTRDDIPVHLLLDKDIPEEVAQMYERLCPAGVYEVEGGKLKINAPNCVDCKATDVLGPRWVPREGGSGPKYRKM